MEASSNLLFQKDNSVPELRGEGQQRTIIVIPLAIPIPDTFPRFGSTKLRSSSGGDLKRTGKSFRGGKGLSEAPDARGSMEPLPTNATRPCHSPSNASEQPPCHGFSKRPLWSFEKWNKTKIVPACVIWVLR
jgi:hypothetical protein